MKQYGVLIPITLFCVAANAQPYSYQLEDAAVGSDVEWSALGKVNWREFKPSSYFSPWGSPPLGFFSGGTPSMTPYGDVLAYTAGGVGDVDGDGYGDFAVTWYEADKDRGDPAGNHPPAWSVHPDNTSSTVVRENADNPPHGYYMERIGLVRVMSGAPNGGNSGTTQDFDEASVAINPSAAPDTLNVDTVSDPDVQDNYIRRIGAPIADLGDPQIHSDFWGGGNNQIWSHEITSVGDIDGDGRDDMMLSANKGKAGLLEIWAFSNRYHDDALDTTDRWVRLLTITGVSDTNIDEEFGYQSYEGPLPVADGMGGLSADFGRDFNDDGQPDLLISSKFYNNDKSIYDRESAPGAAWIYMLPKSDVFEFIDSISDGLCDLESNRNDESVSDTIVDLLPLKLTTSDYNVRITGHQKRHEYHDSGDDHYPRHFGYDVSPAGDLDNDGLLDLVVSAPYHYDQSEYADYLASVSGSTITPPSERHTGNMYFFLSSSSVRGGDTFADLLPKYFKLTSGPYQIKECSGSWYADEIGKRTMSYQQISFDSSEADYLMEGSEVSPNFGYTPFAGHFVAGVNINKDGTPSSDNHPDLVVMEGRRSRFFVFNDLDGEVSEDITNNGYPTSTRLLWDADEGNWDLNANGAVLTKTDVFGVYAWTADDTIEGVVIKGLGAMGPPVSFPDLDFSGGPALSEYSSFDGIVLGGDLTGDGDCEIMVTAHVASSSWNRRQATVALDITSDSSLLTIHAEYLPESFPFAESAMTVPPYGNQSNEFNDGSKIVRTYAPRPWPVWNPVETVSNHNPLGIDDVIIGIRYFPRRIAAYPGPGRTSWVAIPAEGSGSQYGQDYDELTLVPAGKAYLVRSIRPEDEPEPEE